MPSAAALGTSSPIAIDDAVRWGERVLSECGSARTDAMLLVAHARKKPREWLVAHPAESLSQRQTLDFMELCERRRSGEPIAYILGSAGFYGREFAVDTRVLIPRPETEHLVEEAIRFIKDRIQNDRPVEVLDIGVGSGAIACTIAAETRALVTGTDISRAAIDVATDNARRLKVGGRCQFVHGDLAADFNNREFDIIIANLPYIPTADLPQPPNSASFEPREALDGGYDGLNLYRRLVPDVARLLRPGGLLICEAAPPTIESLKSLIRLSLPDFAISVGYDYAGLARYVKASAAIRWRDSVGQRDAEEALNDERSHGWRERGGRQQERSLEGGATSGSETSRCLTESPHTR